MKIELIKKHSRLFALKISNNHTKTINSPISVILADFSFEFNTSLKNYVKFIDIHKTVFVAFLIVKKVSHYSISI